MILRKKFSKVLFASLAVLLAACGTGESEETTGSTASNGEEEITLRVAWWGSQQRHDRTVEVIELYEERNPHVNLEYEFFDFDGYFNNLNTLVAGGEVWDVFQLGGNYPSYIDIIEPLDPYLGDLIDISQTNETYIETTTDEVSGNVVGMSLGVNSYGMAYNPEMFAEAGLEEPSENWTWEEFEEANMTITEELGIYGTSELDDFKAGGTIGVGPVDNFFSGEDQTELGFDDPNMLTDYIAMRKRLVDAGAYPDPGAVAEITGDIEADYMVSGEAAMTWVATNQFPTLNEAAGGGLELTTIPRREADDPYGLTLNSSQMFSIPTTSEHKEEAAKFIDFFLNDEEANEILRGERGVPIMTHIRESLEEVSTEEQQVVFDYIDYVGEQHNDELVVIEHPDTAEIEAQYNVFLEQVLFDDITPEEAAQKIYDYAYETINR